MENAKTIIAEITDNCNQCSASHKDEVTVMKAIMNDTNFSVDVYDNGGKTSEYYPSREIRKMAANVVSNVTKMPIKEARELVDDYEFTKSDANAVVGFTKEFINTYLQTGRKLPLGGRKTSNIELMWKNIEERTAEIPNKNTTERTKTIIPAHGGIKASNKCPEWVK